MPPDHLQPITTEHGFSHLPAIADRHGTEVSASESSAATGPHIWLGIRGEVSLWGPFRDFPTNALPKADVSAHLTVEQAQQVAEQILWLIDHHYQTGSRNSH